MLDQLRAQQGQETPPIGSPEQIARHGFTGRPNRVPYAGFMESAFGRSFSRVRAYMDAPAQAATGALGTEGYMMGDQLAFSSASPSKEVVAHELAHVVQQSGGGSGSADPEADAHAAATAVLAGGPVQIAARISFGTLLYWNSHEHRAFGNLAAIKATGGTFNLNPATDTSIADRNGTLAAIDQQGAGALQVETNDSYISAGPNAPPVRVSNSIAFGDASELSGDYAKTPAILANRESGDGGGGPADYISMALIAQTNVNHFFPLCGQEYQRHHQLAVTAARAGDRKTALLEEGFASHFLQDCYAAGHIAPRALDRVSLTGSGEAELGLNRSKKWHDALNELTTGLPTTRGRFRGDDTMSASDLETISTDTATSLREVLDTLAGRRAAPANISLPAPDHSAIDADPDYGPLWRAMMGDYEADLRNAESTPGGQDQRTDGGTPYSTRDTANAIRENVYGGERTQVKRVTNSEWNGATLVFNVTVDGRAAPVGTELWVKWFDGDSGYDHSDSGNIAGEVTSANATPLQDTDELLDGPFRLSVSDVGVSSARSGHDDSGDTYAVFYANPECTVPIGRSHVQGTNRGAVNKPLVVSDFSWSSNRLSFNVSRDGQPVDGRNVYLKWFDCDGAYDRDSSGNLGQTTVDSDEQMGGTTTVAVAQGRGSAVASGDANNPGDTYATVYLDNDASIPLARSLVQP